MFIDDVLIYLSSGEEDHLNLGGFTYISLQINGGFRVGALWHVPPLGFKKPLTVGAKMRNWELEYEAIEWNASGRDCGSLNVE